MEAILKRTKSLTKNLIRQIQKNGNTMIITATFFILLITKIFFNLKLKFLGYDGSNYTDVALNIRDGFGAVSDIAIFHQGYSFFPHPTILYPLWPYVFGLTSKIINYKIVAIWLPTLFYLLTLLTGIYIFRKISERNTDYKRLKISAATLFVLFLGANPHFYSSTSVPYTEGLAFFVLALAILTVYKFSLKENYRTAVTLGVLTALALLCRAQLFILFIAIALWFTIKILINKEMTTLKCFGLFLISFIVALIPQYIYLSTFVDHLNFSLFLRYDQYQATNYLSPVKQLTEIPNILQFLQDKIPGFQVAFDRESPHSYFKSFGDFVYFIVPASFLILFKIHKEPRKFFSVKVWNDFSFLLFFIIFSLGGFFSLHLIHKQMYVPWNFGLRHALTAAPLIFGSILLCCTHRNHLIRIASLLAFAFCIESNIELSRKASSVMIHDPSSKHTELVQWLNNNAKNKDGRLVVALPRPAPLEIILHTPNVAYHWLYHGTSLQDIRAIFEHLGGKYLLLKEKTYKNKSMKFLSDRTQFDRYFEKTSDRQISSHLIFEFIKKAE